MGKIPLFHFIDKKTNKLNIYKQLDAKRDIKHKTYLNDIKCHEMAKRGTNLSARDVMFAHLYPCLIVYLFTAQIKTVSVQQMFWFVCSD